MRKFLSILLMVGCIMIPTSQAHDEVAVIDPNIILSGKITRAEAKFIFTAKTRYWESGERVTVFHFPVKSKIFQDFVRDILGYNPSDIARTIDYQMNSGSGNLIKFVNNEDQMINMVANTTGAIGYVSVYFYLNNGAGNVKKITIID